MLFTTLPFICLFLPIVVAGYFLSPKHAKNAVLVGASIVFYAWDDVVALLPIGTSIVVNFFVARALGESALGESEKRNRTRLIRLAIAGNVAVLVVYKYTGFIFENLDSVLSPFAERSLPHVRLPVPLGISFFTFHIISYLVDVYRGTARAQKSLGTFALYILNFPQMIAGPIIRYREIADQLGDRPTDVSDVATGVVRLTVGLAKKLLIADPIGGIADQIFAHQAWELSGALAWTGVLAFGLQIYFDFSGYSDMAIGMARIFGFRFPENFNYPYVATSIQDFWHRWHMTLSRWFRDYIYIPLGGNRLGEWTTVRNLWVVFFLAGAWHGASWTFIVWGLWHGLFLALERTTGVRRALAAIGPLRHVYALAVVAISWVFFRAETLGEALMMIRSMLFLSTPTTDFPVAALVSAPMALLMALACALACPIWPAVNAAWRAHFETRFGDAASDVARGIFVAAATIASLASMVLTQQVPFIYFRF